MDRIQKLDQATINRIAAGEIIQKPVNAIKELVENSIDAGSTSIAIQIQGFTLQIQDNGKGIHHDDLPIACERFTTSKLSRIGDLSSLQTFGFRGEALASISHISTLSMVSKTRLDPCAYKAVYEDGKLIGEPKPIAGNVGTLIVAGDLFYNVPTRQKALNPRDEYNRILDCVQRYCIRYPCISFSCKRTGQSPDVSTQSNSTSLKNIELIYGLATARELLHFEMENEEYAFTLNGYITNANFNVKRSSFLLFINGRMVDNAQLKKSIDLLYAKYLPKSSHPFIYLSMEIKPENVDVNIHPTKREVQYLHQDRITELICEKMDEALGSANSSRTYAVQSSILPHLKVTPISQLVSQTPSGSISYFTPQKTPEHKMVRTDVKSRTLDGYVTPLPKPLTALEHDFDQPGAPLLESVSQSTPSKRIPLMDLTLPIKKPKILESIEKETFEKPYIHVQFESIVSLRDALLVNENLLGIFKNFTFIGCVNQCLSLIQHGTKMYMINVCKFSREYFYQASLFGFSNFGGIELDEPVSLLDLIKMELQGQDDISTSAQILISLLSSKADLLNEYFSIGIDSNARLTRLPVLLPTYLPPTHKLPSFLIQLGKVNWTDEKHCFDGICKCLADLYSFDPLETDDISWMIEHVFFATTRQAKWFTPSVDSITPIADLPDLYKVFERC